MPKVTNNPVNVLPAGVTITPVAANQDGGHSIPNARNDVLLLVTNSSGNARNVIIRVNQAKRFRPADGTFPLGVSGDVQANVDPNSSRIYGPFPEAYNDDNNALTVEFSGVTGITIAPLRFAPQF